MNLRLIDLSSGQIFLQNKYRYNLYNIVNMMVGNRAELTSQQLKNREMAEQYLKIQQNTQFLTHLIRYHPHRKRVEAKFDQIIPELRSIAAVAVQISYLLFTCHVKQTNILISQIFYLLTPNRREPYPEISCEYVLEKDFLQLPEEHQIYLKRTFIRHQFSTGQRRAYGQYTMHYLNLLLGIIKSIAQRYKSPPDRQSLRQFLMLEDIVKNHLMPKIKALQHPRIVILSLEESQIFRQYSLLVKVMNNSVFSAIRNSRARNIFDEVVRLQMGLAQLKGSKTQLEVQSKEMQLAIENLFKLFIKYQIISVEQSITDVTKNEQNPHQQQKTPQNYQAQNTNLKPYVLGDVEGTNFNDRKYVCRVNVGQKPFRQFTGKLYESLVYQAQNNYNSDQQTIPQQKNPTETKSLVKNQFLVEYLPAKGILSVKYITPIELNIENTDIVMFQCNSIAFHWSNVSMELVEKTPNRPVKRKERFLALKTLSHLHISEKPLFKLLIMFDLVMLCAKIAEPQLRKSFVRVDDHSKIQEMTEKVDHMIKIFIKKVERYYKMLSQSDIGE